MYVCLCFALTENDIKLCLQGGASLAELKRRTGAGNNCGSCDAHIREMVKRYGMRRKDTRKAG